MRRLEKIAGEEYEAYRPYLSGASQTVGKVGRALGYVGDVVFWGSALAAATNPLLAPYMLTGLLLKKAQVAAQAPEAVRSVGYMAKTGDVLGGSRNMAAKLISYLPGATVLDRGLGRIAEKRMIKRTAYRLSEEFDNNKSWYHKTAEDAEKAGYTGVKVRSENIIRPNFKRELPEKRNLKKVA